MYLTNLSVCDIFCVISNKCFYTVTHASFTKFETTPNHKTCKTYKTYTSTAPEFHSRHQRANSRSEPIEKSARDGCRARALLGVKGRTAPLRIARSECLNDHKRSFSGCAEQPGAERREEADKAGTVKLHKKHPQSAAKKQKVRETVNGNLLFPRGAGCKPCRKRFLRERAALLNTHHNSTSAHAADRGVTLCALCIYTILRFFKGMSNGFNEFQFKTVMRHEVSFCGDDFAAFFLTRP